MRDEINLRVHLAFDEEAQVWYVAESEIPGLRLEADDPMELVKRIAEAAPELVQMNEREILQAHEGKQPAKVRFTPVFDNSLPVHAHA